MNWIHASLQKWLNSDFIDTAFNEYEKSKLLDTNVIVKIYEYGNMTTTSIINKVFLISNDEYDSYHIDNFNLEFATPYAKANGINNDNQWWTRTTLGNANDSSGGVRPAMWISLED